jgi:hypothetical protein
MFRGLSIVTGYSLDDRGFSGDTGKFLIRHHAQITQPRTQRAAGALETRCKKAGGSSDYSFPSGDEV